MRLAAAPPGPFREADLSPMRLLLLTTLPCAATPEALAVTPLSLALLDLLACAL